VIPRRRMLEFFAGGAAGYSFWRAVKAAILPPTPPQTAGPFYPLRFPPDSDNDLVQITGRAGTAKGTITYITGRVLDTAGRAVTSARVEIWQCDATGRYHYVNDGRSDRPLDENFQGYGQTLTDDAGGYRFRTIRPVPYPGRTPHIHFAVSAPASRASSLRCMSPASRSTSATECCWACTTPPPAPGSSCRCCPRPNRALSPASSISSLVEPWRSGDAPPRFCN
jgi:Dioxygenase